MNASQNKRSDDYLVGIMLRAMWEGRGIMALCLLVGILGASVYLAVATPLYRAKATLAPISSSNSMGRAQGAFAAITGISMGSDHESDFNEYLLVLHSATLADRLTKLGLDKELLGGWDRETNQWRAPSGPIAFVKSLLGLSPPAVPTASRFAAYLSDKVVTTPLNTSSSALMQSRTYTVEFDYKNPADARRILDTILHEADAVMRQSQMKTTRNRVAYLQREMKATQDIPLRDSLQAILTNEQQNLMSQVADQYYSIKVVDLPHADDVPVSPRLLIVIAASILIALLLGTGINLFLLWRRFTHAEAVGGYIFDVPFPNPLRRLERMIAPRRNRIASP